MTFFLWQEGKDDKKSQVLAVSQELGGLGGTSKAEAEAGVSDRRWEAMSHKSAICQKDPTLDKET